MLFVRKRSAVYPYTYMARSVSRIPFNLVSTRQPDLAMCIRDFGTISFRFVVFSITESDKMNRTVASSAPFLASLSYLSTAL